MTIEDILTKILDELKLIKSSLGEKGESFPSSPENRMLTMDEWGKYMRLKKYPVDESIAKAKLEFGCDPCE